MHGRVSVARRALIECHDNVSAQRVLNFNAPSRIQMNNAPINVTFESDALIRELINVRERENLKPPAIGQNRPRPSHEPMQIPQLRHHLFPRPKQPA